MNDFRRAPPPRASGLLPCAWLAVRVAGCACGWLSVWLALRVAREMIGGRSSSSCRCRICSSAAAAARAWSLARVRVALGHLVRSRVCVSRLLAQVATTCLFLASKVEETPKKLKDVIIEAYKVQHQTVQPPDPDSQELWKLKEQILICERELLRVLGFDLSVEHAYRPLLAYIKSISGTRDLAQIAWNFINDSLRTTISLQYAPRCLAAATVMMASNYLEAKLQKPCPLPNHPPGSEGKWYTAFQVREETIHDIVKQIQDMYESNKGGAGLLSSNSSAVTKMRMNLDGRGGTAAVSAPGAAAPTAANGSASGGGGGAEKRKSLSGGSGSSSASGGSGSDKVASEVKSEVKSETKAEEAEDGEIEEGETKAEVKTEEKAEVKVQEPERKRQKQGDS